MTTFPGKAAADVDNDLTRLLEEEFASINGVASISATSQTGLSVVRVEFGYRTSSALAAVDVQNAIGRIRHELPAEIDEPQVLEFSTADKPIVTLALASDFLPLTEVRELADNEVRERLERVAGVAAIDVFGGHKLQLHVAIDPDRLEAAGVALEQVMAALADWNLSAPGGRIRDGEQEVVVRFDERITTIDDAARIVLKSHADGFVRLGDVATLTLSAGEPRSAYRHQGVDAIAVQVLRRDEANTVEVAAGVRAAVAGLAAELPALDILVADDDSVFTEKVMADMTRTVFIAIVLTMLVVLLFLAELRQALIIAVSIPAAFLSTFMLMQFAGLDLNMVTMSALILAIGLLVDDGIVILENIHRHLSDRGISAREAAITGTGEVLGAKLAGSLTTLGVLVPLIFMGGFIGELFRPLASTLAFALGSSFVVAVTLVPLMATAWLKPQPTDHKPGRVAAAVDRAMRGIRRFYLAGLWGALRHPLLTLSLAFVLLLVSFGALRMIGSEMLPRFDSGSFQVLVDFVPGTPIEDTLSGLARAEAVLSDRREVVDVGIRVGHERGARSMGQRGAMDINQAEITVSLLPRTERALSQWQIMNEVRRALEQTPGVTLGVPKEMGAPPAAARPHRSWCVPAPMNWNAWTRLPASCWNISTASRASPTCTRTGRWNCPRCAWCLSRSAWPNSACRHDRPPPPCSRPWTGAPPPACASHRGVIWISSCATAPVIASRSRIWRMSAFRPRPARCRSESWPGWSRQWDRASSLARMAGARWTCSAITLAGRCRPWSPMSAPAWPSSMRPWMWMSCWSGNKETFPRRAPKCCAR
jgi:multidrug efflux pump subunit AcrB